MNKIRVYLDNCCYNRPFDDQRQLRVRLETQAKLYIQEQIRDGKLSLVWSFILVYEISANPFIHRKKQIINMEPLAEIYIEANEDIYQKAEEILVKYKVREKDALHIAAALAGTSDYFITTDDKLIRNCRNIDIINVLDPLDFIKLGEAIHENRS